MSRCSAACAASPNPALDVPGSASESPSSIALHTMPRNRGALPAIAACERTSSTPDATRLSSTSRCSMPAKPHNYDRFKPFGALGLLDDLQVADCLRRPERHAFILLF